ncbi:acyltransferase-domain-containing protein [Ceraceosorus guamensis]|uniref:Acyltransferase-domain-containing protein n=1 Tax=Ceraceosorus guamensis TaxID=1522189 RepID=A0A316W6V3_9BASI|nr:acyltransferase-domain-containing protein [Ceraceosorus guamensis]PWN45569.1 acyltransferase-domain-containing protein [Ceraceosorus guamensis]
MAPSDPPRKPGYASVPPPAPSPEVGNDSEARTREQLGKRNLTASTRGLHSPHHPSTSAAAESSVTTSPFAPAVSPIHAPAAAASSSSSSSPGATITVDRHDKAAESAWQHKMETTGGQNLNVVQTYKAHFREDPWTWFGQMYQYGQGTGWRAYTDYIGSPILYPTQSTEVVQSLAQSKQVQERIHALASSRVESLFATVPPPKTEEARKELQRFKEKRRLELERNLTDVARGLAETNVARLDSIKFLRGFAWSVESILARLYHQGIHISVAQVLELRRVASYCAERKISLLFAPSHSSHIDYLTLSWLMFRLGIAVPHIVAGENLDLPVLGNVLKRGGAFFIRRTFAGDQLYPIVIKEYVEQLLAAGKNIECFIEGTRSRTGKRLPPKLGILKYVVEALLNERTEDVFIAPVSVQYDSVIESSTYADELLGKPKEAESLFGLLGSSSSVLQLKLGRIDVRFQTPWSLKGFINEQKLRREAPTPDHKSKMELDLFNNDEHKILLLKALGYRILNDVNNASIIMPAALCGTILLILRGRGIGRSDLIKRVEWLAGIIRGKGYQVADFGSLSTAEVVDRAITGVMKGLVEIETDVMEPTYVPVKRFELSFFRNQVMHVFVSEALLCSALYTRVKQGGETPNQFMKREALVAEAGFISHVLREEFVFNSADKLENNVRATVDQLVADDVLAFDEQNRVGLSTRERRVGRSNFDSYLFLVFPLIEAYWLSACSLLLLAPPPPKGQAPGSVQSWFAAKEFEKRAQLFGKTLYAGGEISYLEAINLATLSAAMVRFQELGFIVRRKSDGPKPVPLVALNPAYVPTYDAEGRVTNTGPLVSFLERLSAFRREGKDRRDEGSVISERIGNVVRANFAPVVELTRLGESRI